MRRVQVMATVGETNRLVISEVSHADDLAQQRIAEVVFLVVIVRKAIRQV